jgi:exodeoxyribonuclease V gamma subunit
MLNRYVAKHLETLLDQLGNELFGADGVRSEALTPQHIIVPNMDMARWMQVKLAQKYGFAGNLVFELPAGYFRRLSQQMSVENVALLDKKQLQWMIFTVLGEGDGKDTYLSWAPLYVWISRVSAVRSGQDFGGNEQGLERNYTDSTSSGKEIGKTGQDLGSGKGNSVKSNFPPTSSSKESPASARTSARWELSAQIADIFDQYLLFRPDWLEAWENGTGSFEEHPWQASLWKAICERWPNMPNRARLMLSFNKDFGFGMGSGSGSGSGLGSGLGSGSASIASSGVGTGAAASAGSGVESVAGSVADSSSNADTSMAQKWHLPSKLFVFGLSSVAPPMLEAVVRSSKVIEVSWYQLSNVGTGDISPDDLFASLQTAQRTFEELFQEIFREEKVEIRTKLLTEKGKVAESDESRSETLGKGSYDAKSNPKTTLSAIQGRLRNRNETYDLPIDDSFQVHKCHSARREVEVLRDRLLTLFETREIRPGDVAIVCPDPALYVPFIEEVFGQADGDRDAPRIPYRISGRFQSDNVLGTEVFLKALQLANSRFKMPEILDWLEFAPVLGDVAESMGLRETLHRWVMDQRIRWGSDAQQINEFGFSMSGRHTWQHGLDRLMLAWLTSENEDVVFEGYLSGSAVATQDAGVLLGRLATLLSALSDLRETAQKTMNLRDWQQQLDALCMVLFGENVAYRRSIDAALTELIRIEELGVESENVPFAVISSHLKTVLGKSGLGRSWNPGVVVCTGMVALHQIPYKVVAMIGLNDGSLPGRTPVAGFDLIPLHPRKGDRLRRESDRQMFLDYVLHTSDVLYISYVGMRQTDNKPMAPSVMITMLLDFMRRSWPARRDLIDGIVKQHALQPFSKIYYADVGADVRAGGGADVGPHKGAHTRSYSVRNAQLASKLGEIPVIRKPLLAEGERLSELRGDFDSNEEVIAITVEELVRFYRNPTQFLLQKMGISLVEGDLPDADSEPFKLDGLETWKLRDAFVKDWFDGKFLGDVEASASPGISVNERSWYDGSLPDEPVATRLLGELEDQVSRYQMKIDSYVSEDDFFRQVRVDRQVTSISATEYQVTGTFKHILNSKLILVEAGKEKAANLLRNWIKHVVINLRYPRQTVVIFNDKVRVFRELSLDEALVRAQNLLYFRELGMQQFLPFFSETAQHYVNKMTGTARTAAMSPSEAYSDTLDISLSEDENNYSAVAKEIEDVWVKYAYADKWPLPELHQIRKLCGLDTCDKPISEIEKSCDLFSLSAVKLMGCMQFDTEDSI